MSMLSAQSDELRKAAQTYRGLGNHRTEQLLLDAADTISELRGALLVAASEHRELEAENAKLRELVRELYEDQCIDGDRWKYRDRMRELGVEVDA